MTIPITSNSDHQAQKLFSGFPTSPLMNPNAAEKDHKTDLMHASENGDLDAIQSLINGGVNVNETDNFGKTALMFAADNNHIEATKALLLFGSLRCLASVENDSQIASDMDFACFQKSGNHTDQENSYPGSSLHVS